MRQCILFIAGILFFFSVAAQLKVQSGASIYLSGNAQVVLKDVDLMNDGTITVPANGRFTFNGTSNSIISGSIKPDFNELEIAKTGVDTLTLQNSVNVNGKIVFTSSLIDLNNNNIYLGSSAFLENENENSRVIGSAGGQLIFSTTLNAPVAANPANLGAIISSTQNLGAVTISRGHKSQTNGSFIGTSILRYFDITPTNNTALNATFRFQYFNHEMNGLPENNLLFWKSIDNVSWSNQGFTSRDTLNNYVEKTGIADLSRWTLSPANSLLPVQFSLFNVFCSDNSVLINWKTAQEQNLTGFTVQKSQDGTNWSSIGMIRSAGNSNIEQAYTFTDDHPFALGAMYRVSASDLNGNNFISSTMHVSCESKDGFKIWPNPVQETLWVNITATANAAANVKIFDSKGTLVKTKQVGIMTGSNQFDINIKTLPAGTYRIMVEWDNGQMQRSMNIIKM